MDPLDQRLRRVLARRPCVVGVGAPDAGDDALGPRLASEIARVAPHLAVAIAGDAPEAHVTRLAGGAYTDVLFLDAVDLGADPGTVALLDSDEMSSRLPQISTHRISIGLLASLIETQGHARAWLLGVQPASLLPGHTLSPQVHTTLDLLTRLFQQILAPAAPPEP